MKEMQKKITDRRTNMHKAGARRLGAQMEMQQPSLLLFSFIILIYYASYLYLYSLRPYSFIIL
jgi:hypothetical protein